MRQALGLTAALLLLATPVAAVTVHRWPQVPPEPPTEVGTVALAVQVLTEEGWQLADGLLIVPDAALPMCAPRTAPEGAG